MVRTRDAQQWKKVDIVARKNYDKVREKTRSARQEEDYFPDIGCPDKEYTGAAEGQEAPQGQEAVQGPEPIGQARPSTQAVRTRPQERWSFQAPQGWTSRGRPHTRSVSARRTKLLLQTRGTGSVNREEGRQ